MASDYFIIPSAADYFCLQAISSLSKTIPSWHREIDDYKKRNNFGEDFAIRNQPKFLGVIYQRYRVRSAKPGKSFFTLREDDLHVKGKAGTVMYENAQKFKREFIKLSTNIVELTK